MFIFYYTTAPQPQEHHSWGDLSGGGAKPWARARMQRALLAALGAQWLGQSLPSTPCFLLRWMGTPPVPETERADSPFPALKRVQTPHCLLQDYFWPSQLSSMAEAGEDEKEVQRGEGSRPRPPR